ncbi:hypothetical protein V6N13_001850 [Hibiscus sabdariffa]
MVTRGGIKKRDTEGLSLTDETWAVGSDDWDYLRMDGSDDAWRTTWHPMLKAHGKWGMKGLRCVIWTFRFNQIQWSVIDDYKIKEIDQIIRVWLCYQIRFKWVISYKHLYWLCDVILD